MIDAARLVVEQAAAKRWLGALVEQYAALLGGQAGGALLFLFFAERRQVVATGRRVLVIDISRWCRVSVRFLQQVRKVLVQFFQLR